MQPVFLAGRPLRLDIIHAARCVLNTVVAFGGQLLRRLLGGTGWGGQIQRTALTAGLQHTDRCTQQQQARGKTPV